MSTFPILFLLSILLSVIQIHAADTTSNRTLLTEDFNQGTSKGLAKTLLSHRDITLAKGAGPDGTDAIRVAYVGYPRGSHRVLARHPIGTKTDRATLSFDVCFDRDFQWTHGGKLHGLAPKNPITGGEDRHPQGWSARIMFEHGGRCATYLYDQDKTEKYGIGETSENPVFKAGKWHHVALQVALNDPKKNNGFARLLIDKKIVVTTENIAFREVGSPETRIQQFLFSTFHGGNKPKWTPLDKNGQPATVYAYFDNFVITDDT